MSGVTPEATTAALAACVPKESDKVPETETVAPAIPTISSVTPESTTAALAKDATLESKRDSTPGAFPVTPSGEPEQFSVKPIPATEGAGNPIQLQPGEPVPDPSTITNNTVTSTVTTDKEGYEKDASAAGFAPPEETVTTLPVTTNGTNGLVEPFIQSAAPTSTTAALAGAVPLENVNRNTNGFSEPQVAANEVPEVVKESLAKAHKEPEAAGIPLAVEEKKEVEEELLKNVEPAEAAGDANIGVPLVVRRSIDEAHWNAEAADVPEAVVEKKEVEQELLHDVKRVDDTGEPAPVITAETAATASDTTPEPAAAPPAAAASLAPDVSRRNQDRSISPKTREPRDGAADNAGPPMTTEQEQTQPTVTTTTTGPETAAAPAVSQGQTQTQTQEPAGANSAAIAAAAAAANTTPRTATAPTEAGATDHDSKPRKKKNRASAIFSKLKEKFK